MNRRIQGEGATRSERLGLVRRTLMALGIISIGVLPCGWGRGFVQGRREVFFRATCAHAHIAGARGPESVPNS